jgi:hypothetical protein
MLFWPVRRDVAIVAAQRIPSCEFTPIGELAEKSSSDLQ